MDSLRNIGDQPRNARPRCLVQLYKRWGLRRPDFVADFRYRTGPSGVRQKIDALILDARSSGSINRRVACA